MTRRDATPRPRDGMLADPPSIMLPADKGLLSRTRSATARFQLRLLAGLPRTVTVRDAGATYRYRCETLEEYQRATSLTWKEPGTYRWLREAVRPGDVFYDIGANMGIYTIPAAEAVGGAGAVVAFEPHLSNARSLLRNVHENGFGDRVRVLSCALHDRDGFFDFKYSEWSAGSAMSQLTQDHDPFGNVLRPVGSELKFATSVDRLVADGVVPPPSLVKMDVDGNELQILRGMREQLAGDARPRAIQVEVNVEEREELLRYMEETGYELAGRHYTAGIQALLDQGQAADELPYNGVFSPRAA